MEAGTTWKMMMLNCCWHWFFGFLVDRIIEDATNDASSLYAHPLLQQVHEFIIDKKLSVSQGDALLDLWTETHGINATPKPTVKNLNNILLEFVQGSDVKEKKLGNPQFDGKQDLKLIWKDVLGMVKKTLANPKFKDHLHYEPKIEK